MRFAFSRHFFMAYSSILAVFLLMLADLNDR